MPRVPSELSFAAELETEAASRAMAAASKRKINRIEGSVEVLDALTSIDGPIGTDVTAQLIDMEAQFTCMHGQLVDYLDQIDGGEALKRARVEWWEAAGTCEFVKSHDLLRQYLPAMEREVQEARERLEGTAPLRATLKEDKAQLAKMQGKVYALLELGFHMPGRADVQAHREKWEEELAAMKEVSEAHHVLKEQRKKKLEEFHLAQGWRKGAERFGAHLGMSEEYLLSCRLKVLEAEATMLRLSSRATLTLFAQAHVKHERALAELHAVSGQVATFTRLRTAVCSSEQLAAEEYEAGLEAEVLKGTLSSLAPRTVEALHLQLAWHAKLGACKAGESLHAPNLDELAAALADASRLAEAAEPVRREESVLRAKLAKLQGKLHGLSKLRTLADGHEDRASIRAEADNSLKKAQLIHLWLSMEVADLRLVTMAHDRAQANLHAASGALVCAKKLELAMRSGVAKSVAEHGLRARVPYVVSSAAGVAAGAASEVKPSSGLSDVDIELSGAGASGPFASDGRLSHEMRHFVHGCFAPMLRAAMSQVLLQWPEEPFAFLADWFWQHSALNRYEQGGATLTQRDVDRRRKAVAAAHDDLALAMRGITLMLDDAEQERGANAMLDNLRGGLPQSEARRALRLCALCASGPLRIFACATLFLRLTPRGGCLRAADPLQRARTHTPRTQGRGRVDDRPPRVTAQVQQRPASRRGRCGPQLLPAHLASGPHRTSRGRHAAALARRRCARRGSRHARGRLQRRGGA